MNETMWHGEMEGQHVKFQLDCEIWGKLSIKNWSLEKGLMLF